MAGEKMLDEVVYLPLCFLLEFGRPTQTVPFDRCANPGIWPRILDHATSYTWAWALQSSSVSRAERNTPD